MPETLSIIEVIGSRGIADLIGFPIPEDYCHEYFDRERILLWVLHDLANILEINFYKIINRDFQNETITLVAVQSKYNEIGLVEKCNRIFKRNEILQKKEIIADRVKALCEKIEYTDQFYPFTELNKPIEYENTKIIIAINFEAISGKNLQTAYNILKTEWSNEVMAYVLNDKKFGTRLEIGKTLYPNDSIEDSGYRKKVAELIERCNQNYIIFYK